MERKLTIVTEGKDQGGSKSLKDLNKDLQGVDTTAKKTGGGMNSLNDAVTRMTGVNIASLGPLAVVTGAVTGLAAVSQWAAEEAEEAARVDAQLNAVLESTGMAAGMTAGELDALANDLQTLTGVEDDVIKRNEAILLTFKEIGEDVFPQTMQAALDMSAALGQDLQSSVTMLGKALNDPIEGLSALQRVGVTFSEAQEKQIKAMAEAGDVMGAQELILEELNSEFGGTAEAMLKAGDGSTELKNALGQLGETIGSSVLPAQRDFNGTLEKIVYGLGRWLTSTRDLKLEMADSEAEVRASADSYSEYITALDAMVASQGMFIEDGNLMQMVYSNVTGKMMPELVQANYTVTESTWDAINAWTDGEEGLGAFGREMQTAGKYADELGKDLEGAAEGFDVVADSTKRANDALAGIGPAAKKSLGELDISLDNTISNYLEQIAFLQGGGAEIQAAFESVRGWVEDGKITPAQAEDYMGELFVQSEALQVDLGNITAADAAQNIADTLGVSLENAKKMLDDIIALDGFTLEGFLNLNVYANAVAPEGGSGPGGGGGGGGGNGGGNELRAGGGPVRADGSYVVGEMGVELFKPNRAGQVVPNDQVGAAGGNIFNLYFPDAIIRNDQEVELLARRVAAQLVEVLR
jgi:hypothetical protein